MLGNNISGERTYFSCSARDGRRAKGSLGTRLQRRYDRIEIRPAGRPFRTIHAPSPVSTIMLSSNKRAVKWQQAIMYQKNRFSDAAERTACLLACLIRTLKPIQTPIESEGDAGRALTTT